MKPIVVRHGEGERRERVGGIVSWRVFSDADTRLLIGRSRIPPQASAPIHNHDVQEIIVVADGTAVLTTVEREENGEDRTESAHLLSGDMIAIPAKVWHSIRNSSSEELDILWIYPAASVKRAVWECKP